MIKMFQKKSFLGVAVAIFLSGTLFGGWMTWSNAPIISREKLTTKWTSLATLTAYDPDDNKTIPLTIVDEHHEVIPYWLRAVHMGKLKKSGNTLIHIDGHSDMATPENVISTKNFSIEKAIPGNVRYMRLLMETNDVFIVGAVLAGLVDHVIWVRPTWLKNDESTDYRMGVGITNLTDPPQYCYCMRERLSSRGKECGYLNRSAINAERRIRGRECPIFKSFRFTTVSESRIYRLRVLTGSTFLDIDEDYFGVETDVSSLLGVGFTVDSIEEINSALSVLYCPESTHDELVHNEHLRSLLIRLLELKSKQVDADEIVSALKKKFTSEPERVRHCIDMTTEQMDVAASTLSNLLASLNPNQVQALYDAKFCLYSSPIFEERPRLNICHGKVFPHDAATEFYLPSKADIAARAARMEVFIQGLFNGTNPPQIVTIARSIRDGYTPRRHFRTIEDTLLRLLHRSAESKGFRLDVEFDENLLFATDGWES